MFAPDSVRVPAADFSTVPLPDTTPAYVNASERSNFNVPEFATFPVAIDPAVEPAPTRTVPAEIVRSPVKVFSPVNVSTAEPVLVSPVELPEMTPEIVAPAESFTVEFAERAIVPDNVPAAEKFTAPAADTPVPAIVSGSATVLEVAISSVAPLVTVVDERVPAFSPRPVPLETFNVPAETDVLPV